MDRHEEGGIALGALLGALRRRIGLILAVTLLTAGLALGFSLLKDKEYSASASLLAQSPNLDQVFGSLQPSQSTPEREAATNLELATQGVIARRAANRLNRRGASTAAAAVNDVKVSSEGQSNLIKVKATAPKAEAAAEAANAFASEYVTFRRGADRSTLRRAQRVVRRELHRLAAARSRAGGGTSDSQRPALTQRIRSLEERSGDLRILELLQTGNAAVVGPATAPSSASSPKPVRNTVIGGFVGLLLGLGLALGREQLDRRLRDSRDLEEAFGLPVLASLPESHALHKGYSIARDLPPFEAEAFRMLRANLRYLLSDQKIDSVLVTSASVEDGKTTVALNLATAATAAGLKVLLVEANVRRPSLAGLLGLPPDEGLTSVLADPRRRLADVSHEVLLAHSTNGGGSPPTMDVVLAGQISPNASELIESERMRELIREAKRNYSLVVIDTPPAQLVSDAIPLMSEVSAVVIVGRIGRITSDEAGRLSEQLRKVSAPTVGIVANFTGHGDGGYRPGGYGLVDPPRSA